MLPFHTFDVFTDRPYSGNPLAIVDEADSLSTKQMQTIAREFNLSETIFVRRPTQSENTAEVRIFFPTAEIPFAGHPTIGCAIFLAERLMGDGDWETAIKLEEQAGLVPVTVRRFGGRTLATLTAPVVPHAPVCEPDDVSLTKLLPKALGIEPSSIGFDHHAPKVWSGGPSFLFVPVVGIDVLSKSVPCEPAWSELMDAAGVDSAYVYARNPDGGYRARMFSPTAGIPEDPATGSASAILAAQLLAAKELQSGWNTIRLRQGIEMQRPSEIELSAHTDRSGLTEVRISGTAVPISSGYIAPPH